MSLGKIAAVVGELRKELIPSSSEMPVVCSGNFGCNDDRFYIISECYVTAAKCLLSAQYREVFMHSIVVGHSVDKKIQELFRKASNADRLTDTSKLNSYWKLRLKERSLLNFRRAVGHLRTHENPNIKKIQKKTDSLYQKELKIAKAFEQIAKENTFVLEERTLEWRCLMNTARHLLMAGRLAPSPEEKINILQRAETIAKKIWFECKEIHPICFPEFNPNRSQHVEGTVLGEVQRELENCSITPNLFGSCAIVTVDARFEEAPKQPVRLWD